MIEKPHRVGETPLAQDFFAGRYERVLGATVDSAAAGAPPVDVAFAIGALAFVGRLVEAESLLDGVRESGELRARTLAAGLFFIAVARLRAGHVDEGTRSILDALRATHGQRDAWVRSLLWQGIACCRYFASDFRGAERAATAALRNSQAAHFAYAQLLANDMRGHLLLRRGRFHEGLIVLERARTQALKLDFHSNAHVIEIAITLARASAAPCHEAIALLETLRQAEHAQDSYSRRTILLELATRRAWTGDARQAQDLLDEAAPLCAGDDRAQVELLCARAELARVVRGWDAAEPLVARASEILPRGVDAGAEAQLAAIRLGAARARGDAAAVAEAVAWLRSLSVERGLYRATAWLAIYDEGATSELADEDRASPCLAAVARGAAQAVVAAGLLGLLPEALGLAPGQRLHVLDDALLVERAGQLERRPALTARGRATLTALAKGAGARDRLLAAVWGLRVYDPERHDSVVKTTISRLRSALGTAACWIETTEGGYGLADGVSVVGVEAPLATVAEAAVARPPATGRRRTRMQRVLETLQRTPDASLRQVARAIGAPARTTSRYLSQLTAAHCVTRLGSGPATRYRLSSAEPRSSGRRSSEPIRALEQG